MPRLRELPSLFIGSYSHYPFSVIPQGGESVLAEFSGLKTQGRVFDLGKIFFFVLNLFYLFLFTDSQYLFFDYKLFEFVLNLRASNSPTR